MAKKTVEEKEKELLAKAEKLKLAQKKIKEAQETIKQKKREAMCKVITENLGENIELELLKQIIIKGKECLNVPEENKQQIVTPEAVQHEGFQNRY